MRERERESAGARAKGEGAAAAAACQITSTPAFFFPRLRRAAFLHIRFADDHAAVSAAAVRRWTAWLWIWAATDTITGICISAAAATGTANGIWPRGRRSDTWGRGKLAGGLLLHTLPRSCLLLLCMHSSLLLYLQPSPCADWRLVQLCLLCRDVVQEHVRENTWVHGSVPFVLHVHGGMLLHGAGDQRKPVFDQVPIWAPNDPGGGTGGHCVVVLRNSRMSHRQPGHSGPCQPDFLPHGRLHGDATPGRAQIAGHAGWYKDPAATANDVLNDVPNDVPRQQQEQVRWDHPAGLAASGHAGGGEISKL